MYVTDLEEKFAGDGFRGIEVDLLKLFLLLLLYADDIVFFRICRRLKKRFTFSEDYCDKWKLIIKTSKTKLWCSERGYASKKFKKIYLFLKDHCDKWKLIINTRKTK